MDGMIGHADGLAENVTSTELPTHSKARSSTVVPEKPS